ncbi:unnamed protein product [Prorocentrum cordatum]|uniref:Uncharacterized protein n=1 Tax=Prorocentrum cordatum TaxID=2364126 RepID=A0ABN9VUW7_9DINO|nr:unnamed protein product [Polarella glacialis]
MARRLRSGGGEEQKEGRAPEEGKGNKGHNTEPSNSTEHPCAAQPASPPKDRNSGGCFSPKAAGSHHPGGELVTCPPPRSAGAPDKEGKEEQKRNTDSKMMRTNGRHRGFTQMRPTRARKSREDVAPSTNAFTQMSFMSNTWLFRAAFVALAVAWASSARRANRKLWYTVKRGPSSKNSSNRAPGSGVSKPNLRRARPTSRLQKAKC